MNSNAPPQRFDREAIWVLAMTLLAAGVRLRGVGRLGLDQFDEGVYALSGLVLIRGGGLGAFDSSYIPYAPPGFPTLIAAMFGVIGTSAMSAILVSILAGTMTVPAIAWLSRRAFGPGAGAASASLSALSGPLVVFSRAALTDASFLLVWVAGMAAGLRYLERPSIGRAIVLGIAIGLAQNFKYNGGMIGLIVAMAAVAEVLRVGGRSRAAWRLITRLPIAAVVAAIVYAPWFLHVQRISGYGALLAHHRSYIDGPSAWWSNWIQQLAQVSAMRGVLGGDLSWEGAALSIAWIGASIGQGRSSRTRRRFGPAVPLLLALLSLLAPVNLSWWATVAWLPWLLVGSTASGRLVAVWWGLMVAVTPLYHPYARLWLPTLAASYVAAGGLVATVLDRFRRSATPETNIARKRSPIEPAILAGIVAVGLAIVGNKSLCGDVSPFPNLLGPSDGVRRFASAMVEDQRTRGRSRDLVVFARPPLLYYLRERWPGSIVQAADLEQFRSLATRGRIGVVDAALGDTDADLKATPGGPWGIGTPTVVPLSIPTLLDLRPESIRDPERRAVGQGGGRQIPLSDAAGTSTFWTFNAEPQRGSPSPVAGPRFP